MNYILITHTCLVLLAAFPFLAAKYLLIKTLTKASQSRGIQRAPEKEYNTGKHPKAGNDVRMTSIIVI